MTANEPGILDPVPGGPRKPKSDLPARASSAFVMICIAGAALFAGGWIFAGFVGLVSIGLIAEFGKLVFRMRMGNAAQLALIIFGLFYIGLAGFMLIELRTQQPDEMGIFNTLTPIILVIATDVGAYFSGRKFGGAKIAPRISPSKTWAGLYGGMAASALLAVMMEQIKITNLAQRYIGIDGDPLSPRFGTVILVGAAVAVLAQMGDFFESYMKRRAGVKDSGRLIPGHGGLFDRTDGLMAVLFVYGLFVFLIAGGEVYW